MFYMKIKVFTETNIEEWRKKKMLHFPIKTLRKIAKHYGLQYVHLV